MTTEKKVLAFELMPELIQNLVERVESLEKTVREQQQPQPLEGELMSVKQSTLKAQVGAFCRPRASLFVTPATSNSRTLSSRANNPTSAPTSWRSMYGSR